MLDMAPFDRARRYDHAQGTCTGAGKGRHAQERLLLPRRGDAKLGLAAT